MGLPTAGRTRYQQWLGDQWRVPAAEYIMSQARGFGGLGPEGQSFGGYLQERGDQPVGRLTGDYLGAGTALGEAPVPEQEAFFARQPGWLRSVLFKGSLRNQGYARPFAGGITAQAFNAPSLRGFDVSRRSEEDSFINYLREKYGL
jgi:hypothetical protein